MSVGWGSYKSQRMGDARIPHLCYYVNMLSSATKNISRDTKSKSRLSGAGGAGAGDKLDNSSISEKSQVKQLTVLAEFSGQRLDNFLINLLKGLPKTRIYRIIRKGEVRVNKGRIKPDYRIQEGDIIRIPPIRLSIDPFDPLSSRFDRSDLSDRSDRSDCSEAQSASAQSSAHPSATYPLATQKSGARPSAKIQDKLEKLLSNILYEDEGLMIVNKPSGMAVHGGSGLSFGMIEAFRVLRKDRKDSQNLELVHRIDRETSGCLMIAKRRSTLKWLHELLRTGQIEKRYWALVKGEWKGGLVVDQALIKNQLSSGERIVRARDGEGSKAALTAFKVLESYGTNTPKASLMEASPITGRTHQIRVHAQYVGSPVAGDEKYGDDSFNRDLKKLGLSRLFLHAVSISIPGLTTVEAPLEKGLAQVLSRLSLSGESFHD